MPGGREKIGCQMPGGREFFLCKCPGVSRGGMVRVGIERDITQSRHLSKLMDTWKTFQGSYTLLPQSIDQDVCPLTSHVTMVAASLQDNTKQTSLKADGHMEDIPRQLLIQPENQQHNDVGEGFGKILDKLVEESERNGKPAKVNLKMKDFLHCEKCKKISGIVKKVPICCTEVLDINNKDDEDETYNVLLWFSKICSGIQWHVATNIHLM